MKVFRENYGADADGNRGVMTSFYELDSDDEPEIKEQIKDAIEDGAIDSFSDSLQIVLIDPYSEEDVYFDINVSEYIEEEELDKLVKLAQD